MPPNSRAKKADAKTAVQQYLKSIRHKEYPKIVCKKCNHKFFVNIKDIQRNMETHYLRCDPTKVQWCNVCITHSTTNDYDMKRHKSSQHPGYRMLRTIFDTIKHPNKAKDNIIHAESISWKELDIDTLYQYPDMFKEIELADKTSFENEYSDGKQCGSYEYSDSQSHQHIQSDANVTKVSQVEETNNFVSLEQIKKGMMKQFPIAAIDIETAKYYKTEQMELLSLQEMLCRNELSDIITLSIVSIDKELKVFRKTYTFKPKMSIDIKATKVHGFDDKYFVDHADEHDYFNIQQANEIFSTLQGMKQVFAHNISFDFYHIRQEFKKLDLGFYHTIKQSCTFQLALDLGLPLKLDYLTNALNVGQREDEFHSSIEDAELTLNSAIKMKWLKQQGLKNRKYNLRWFDSILSRDYDKQTLQRLDQVLQYYQNILEQSSQDFQNNLTIELCAGQGRNISTILKILKPSKFVAIDYNKQSSKEILERWQSYDECEVGAAQQYVSKYIEDNTQQRCQALIGFWSLGYMSEEEQEQLLEWIMSGSQPISLFIEPIGKGETLDEGRLIARKLIYYDRLFKKKGFHVLKEGRFIWNDIEEKFEHFTHTTKYPKYVPFNRTYYWIISTHEQ